MRTTTFISKRGTAAALMYLGSFQAPLYTFVRVEECNETITEMK